jgi:hypothetical protein
MELKAGYYRHYKGNLYEVLHTARDSETERWVVVYRALYGEYGLWVRDYEMFVEKVEVDGILVDRFTFLEEFFDDTDEPK